MIYCFNNFIIDTDNFSLKSDGKIIEVEPQVFNLIVYLIENKSKLVSRDELLENVWQGRIVLDATLNNHIKAARNVLGDDGQSQNVIKTIHSRGYQFVAEIQKGNESTQVSGNGDYFKKILPYLFLIIIALIVIYYFSARKAKNPISTNLSIAVLAFLDMSPEQNQEYFSDGMSEEILNKLAKIPDLRVISRISSFYFKDKDKTAQEIGQQLNVSHILEGSVRKQEDKLRITVQLIESKSATHIWSENYDRTMNDVFQIQDDIAESVSKKLKLSLLSKPEKVYSPNLEAYNVFLQANHLVQKSTKKALKEAEFVFRKSIAFDPNYAPAWQQLGKTIFSLTFNHGARSTNDGLKTSSFAVKKAIELDPNYASSYATLARIQSQQRNFIEADNTMKKALALDYTHSYINAVAASNAMFSGNLALALSYREKVKDIDPKYFHNYYGIGLIHFFDNNMDKALKAFQEYEKYNPNKDALNYMISAVLLNQGQTELAYEYAQKETDDFWKNYAMNLVLIAQNKQIEADKLLMAFINRYQNSDLANIARIYAFRGEIDKSLEWLEKAFNHPDSTLIHVLNFPDFRKMHFDTRWHDLIRKMKFPDNHWLVKKLPQS